MIFSHLNTIGSLKCALLCYVIWRHLKTGPSFSFVYMYMRWKYQKKNEATQIQLIVWINFYGISLCNRLYYYNFGIELNALQLHNYHQILQPYFNACAYIYMKIEDRWLYFKVALGVYFALKSWKEYLLLFTYLITLGKDVTFPLITEVSELSICISNTELKCGLND